MQSRPIAIRAGILAILALAASWWSAAACLGMPAEFEGQFTSMERALLAAADAGHPERFSLLAAALVAGGLDDAAALERCEKQLAGWVVELKQSGKVAGSPRAQARAIFEFMHARILTGGYHSECSDLRTAMTQGRYNCVSATILFNCLTERFGLRVYGLESPSHAMSTLACDGNRLDIETTCPRWFEVLDDPRRRVAVNLDLAPDESAKNSAQTAGKLATAASAVAATPMHRGREVSGVQLAAMIYYNRGVDLLAAGRFRDALAANAKAIRLDAESQTARGNLLATLNNWAIALGAAGRYGEAVKRLDQGLDIEPSHETLKANYVQVHYHWSESLCRAGRYAEALAVLERAARRQPGQPYFAKAALDVRRRWSGGE